MSNIFDLDLEKHRTGTIALDDKTEEPNVEQVEKKEPVQDPIIKNEGTRRTFNGRDYEPTRAIVIPSTYKDAEDGEKHLHLSQGRGTGISISLLTLKEMIRWAESPEDQG